MWQVMCVCVSCCCPWPTHGCPTFFAAFARALSSSYKRGAFNANCRASCTSIRRSCASAREAGAGAVPQLASRCELRASANPARILDGLSGASTARARDAGDEHILGLALDVISAYGCVSIQRRTPSDSLAHAHAHAGAI